MIEVHLIKDIKSSKKTFQIIAQHDNESLLGHECELSRRVCRNRGALCVESHSRGLRYLEHSTFPSGRFQRRIGTISFVEPLV